MMVSDSCAQSRPLRYGDLGGVGLQPEPRRAVKSRRDPNPAFAPGSEIRPPLRSKSAGRTRSKQGGSRGSGKRATAELRRWPRRVFPREKKDALSSTTESLRGRPCSAGLIRPGLGSAGPATILKRARAHARASPIGAPPRPTAAPPKCRLRTSSACCGKLSWLQAWSTPSKGNTYRDHQRDQKRHLLRGGA